jgi:hypothetical protein
MKKVLIGMSLVMFSSSARAADPSPQPCDVVEESVTASVQQEQTPPSSVQATIIESPDLFLIDSIKAVLYSEEGSDIITFSEINRPSLDGAFRSLNDLIMERLMYLDAKRFKILPDEETIDKHLKAVQREHNMTLDQLKEVFKAAGYTYEEGREQFAVMTTISSMLDFKIRSRLIIPERDVVKYYEEHPIIEPATFHVQRAVVPYPTIQARREKRRLELEQFAATGVDAGIDIEWSTSFWVNQSELAEDKLAIIAPLNPGCVSNPVALEDGFEIYRLIEKKAERVVPLQERYQEISNILRKPRYEMLMEEYKKNLLDGSSIIYF